MSSTNFQCFPRVARPEPGSHFFHSKEAFLSKSVWFTKGYLVNHFLYAKAKHVIGTEIDPQILTTIPREAYNVYDPAKQKVEFKLEDFRNVSPQINVDIITIFIGNLEIVQNAIELFRTNRYVKVLAFMVPTRGFSSTKQHLEELCDTLNWSFDEIKIHLSRSGEQRRTIVLKKPVTVVDLSHGGKKRNLF